MLRWELNADKSMYMAFRGKINLGFIRYEKEQYDGYYGYFELTNEEKEGTLDQCIEFICNKWLEWLESAQLPYESLTNAA